ncbi:MAG: hypothetical protein WC538_21070 [Thermoanaerobaculia bacterium]|jgi:hypothetical protein
MEPISIIADHDLLATVIAVVLARAGFAVRDDGPFVVRAGAHAVVIAGRGREVTLERPIYESDLVAAVSDVVSDTHRSLAP